MKEKLEKLQISRSSNTIISFHAVSMYPSSVKFIQIERAVNYFLRDGPAEDREAACKCLEMVKCGMSNCLVQFNGVFWEYGGTIEAEAKGLAIGGYESAFFLI